MPSLFKGLEDASFPGHSLVVYEDEFGAFQMSCSWLTCEWHNVEIAEDDVPKAWFYKHYLHAIFRDDPLAFLK